MHFTGGFDVTPHDDNDLPHMARALIPAATGDITVVCKNGDTFTLTDVIAGQTYHLPLIRKVLDTGTDAIAIVALY